MVTTEATWQCLSSIGGADNTGDGIRVLQQSPLLAARRRLLGFAREPLEKAVLGNEKIHAGVEAPPRKAAGNCQSE